LSIAELLAAALRHHREGCLAEAEALYCQILQRDPRQSDAWHLRGILAQQSGQFEIARRYIQHALALNPQSPLYHSNLGIVLNLLGQREAALQCYRQALALSPDCFEAWVNLGHLSSDVGQYHAAIACCAQARRLQPRHVGPYATLSAVYQATGRTAKAVAACRRRMQREPADAAAHSALLTTLLFRPGITLRELAAEHAEFQRRHAAGREAGWQPHRVDRDPRRRLRVGFLSHLMWDNPATMLLLPVFEALRLAVDVFCYSCNALADAAAQRFRSAARGWRDVSHLSDEVASQQIRDDRVDILFDIGGHLTHNRILIFAHKPAPIQITWLAYEGTTGLAAMDCILADRHVIPPGSESFYCERVLRLPDAYVCHRPWLEYPPVGPLPALRAGCVTFGSFSGPTKINRDVVALWSRVLRRVTGSRLLLKNQGFDLPDVQRRHAAWFRAEGIAPDRVEFAGATPLPAAWEDYNRVDIALDPFPFSGSLTTCDALWMGVPVITWPGETLAGRHSLTLLATLGLTETIARDPQDYVEIAETLAADLPGLAALRAGLRARMEASPLCDVPRFVGNFSALLRNVWQRWCDGNEAGGTNDGPNVIARRS